MLNFCGKLEQFKAEISGCYISFLKIKMEDFYIVRLCLYEVGKVLKQNK